MHAWLVAAIHERELIHGEGEEKKTSEVGPEFA